MNETIVAFHNRLNQQVNAQGVSALGRPLSPWMEVDGRLYHRDPAAGAGSQLVQYFERPEIEGDAQLSRSVRVNLGDGSDPVSARLRREVHVPSGLVWVIGDRATPDSSKVTWDEIGPLQGK
jgi:hypothetical protein